MTNLISTLRARRVLAAGILLAIGGAAQAATLTVGNGTAPTTGGTVSPNPIVFSFTADGTTAGYGARILYNAALFDATATSANGATCNTTVDGQITVINNDTNGAALATGPQCNITFTAASPAAAGTYPLDLTISNPGEGCFDVNAAASTCDLVDGQIVVAVAAGPTAPVIDLPAGPLATTGGTIGGTGSVTVTIDTPTDGTLGGTANVACTIPAGTVGFTAGAVSGNPFSTGTGSVTVSCTLGAAAATGTLSCTGTAVAPATGGNTDTVDINCPAGSAPPPTSGEFQGNLNVTLSGVPGGAASGTATYQNVGDGQLTISGCTPSAGITVSSTFPQNTAPGGSNAIGLSCTAPAIAGDSVAGTLTCTTNDPDDGEGTVTFAVSCASQVVSVPTMGGAGKGLLAAMIAAVGLLGFSLRRKLV